MNPYIIDLPWNPAVLEQRIGRVHRLGQRQPVRVVNFVAQGTIEEGMLSLLKFKTSLFAGALDGGEKEVFLGGSRLKRFMETVETATSSIPQPAAQDPPEDYESTDGNGHGDTAQPESAIATPAPPTPAPPTNITSQGDPWSGLLQTGLAILEQLAAASHPAAPSSPRAATATSPGLSFIHRDTHTGETYLKFPAPSPEVLDRVLGAVGLLLERFKR